MDRPGRVERLVEALGGAGLDWLIVGDLVTPADSGREAGAPVFWLTGFGGSSGLVALSADGKRRFVTDFRYAGRIESLRGDGWEVEIAGADPLGAVAEGMAGQIGFDPERTSVSNHERLVEVIGSAGQLVAASSLIATERRCKDRDEIAAIAAAAELADAVLAELEAGPLVGRSEAEVALWIELRIRQLGASGPSFSPIVAAGPNGALPHAAPSARPIEAGELVVVDLGAVVDGYCSDCTRTYAAGRRPAEPAEAAYAAVLAAQVAALGALSPGLECRAADAVARDLLNQRGFGEEFGHGLGHGVGVEIHEPPRLSARSKQTLAVGDVVTVEPGVYLPGEFGIRIEDLVLLADDGVQNFCARSKELLVCR